jgi:phosphate butyryltransferase
MDSISGLISIAKTKSVKRLVVASAEDLTVLMAVQKAFDEGFISPILIGNKQKILDICNNNGIVATNFEIINEPDPALTTYKAVALINAGQADILMKGLISTATLLKAVIAKDNGLRKSQILSHFAIFESKCYHKIFGISDAAMNIAPTLEEKILILNNAVGVMCKLGIEVPKVAILAPVETVSDKIESTMHAAMITIMNKRGQIKNCIVDGPLSFDNIISSGAAQHKGITSEVAGDADIIIVPDLDCGNALYKSLIFMGGTISAAIVAGAKVPIVLTSRSDLEYNKFMSIAFAAALDKVP